MKVNKNQAEKAINGKNAQDVYDSLDFNALPYDEENDRYPTLDDVIAGLQSDEENS